MATNPMRAADLLNTMGIGAPSFAGSVDVNAELKMLQYLGIQHVRQGVQYPDTIAAAETLARAGVKFDTSVADPQQDVATIMSRLDNIAQLQKDVPGSIYSIEGPNEANDASNGFTYNGSSLADAGTAAAAQQALWNAVKANPALAGVKVLSQSISEGVSGYQGYLQGEGNLSAYADSVNIHTYPNNGDQPFIPIQTDMGRNQSVVPGKAPTITEIGYITDPSSGLYVDQATQAKNDLNIYLDAAKAGVATTYVFTLYDYWAGQWGVFQSDQSTAKPAATAIHNLTTILADSGSSASSFQTGTLNYSISNETSTTHDMLLEKSNGTFDLAVWGEQKDWNGSAISVGTQSQTVNLGATYAKVEVFDPLQGTTPIQTLTNVSQVQLGVTDHALIVQVEPQGSPPPPPPPPPPPRPRPL